MGCTGYRLYDAGESILVSISGINLAFRALPGPFRAVIFRHNSSPLCPFAVLTGRCRDGEMLSMGIDRS